MRLSPRRHEQNRWALLAFAALIAAATWPLAGSAATETTEYDELGRLRKITYANGLNTSFTLDAAGNRTAVTTGSTSTPTSMPVTGSTGAVVPAAASLYTVVASCSGVPRVCSWVVRKLYADGAAVIAVVHAPNGTDPACNSGVTQQISNGYSRSGCSLSALSSVYGN